MFTLSGVGRRKLRGQGGRHRSAAGSNAAAARAAGAGAGGEGRGGASPIPRQPGKCRGGRGGARARARRPKRGESSPCTARNRVQRRGEALLVRRLRAPAKCGGEDKPGARERRGMSPSGRAPRVPMRQSRLAPRNAPSARENPGSVLSKSPNQKCGIARSASARRPVKSAACTARRIAMRSPANGARRSLRTGGEGPSADSEAGGGSETTLRATKASMATREVRSAAGGPSQSFGAGWLESVASPARGSARPRRR